MQLKCSIGRIKIKGVPEGSTCKQILFGINRNGQITVEFHKIRRAQSFEFKGRKIISIR